ncbi:MAG: hypothetical protein IJY25_03850 [Bacilli bacterium]|nr:hypothetical protein [Bacilli bacterium]
MKIFMYDENEAKKNKCDYKLPPVVYFMIYLSILIVFLFFNIFSFIFINSQVLVILFWIVWVVYMVLGMIKFIKSLKRNYWGKQIAFIKEDDTFWAVKLVYLNDSYFTINSSDPVMTGLTLGLSVNSAINVQKQEKIMNEKKKEASSYVKALQETKEELEYLKQPNISKDKIMITKDLDKNFELIFNGNKAIIRLDDIKFERETTDSNIYSYKNYKGKTVEFEVIKAYYQLKEEINNTNIKSYDKPFIEEEILKVLK